MKDRIQKEQKFWDSFAKKYDKNNRNNASEAYNALYDMLSEDITGTKSILEIATGTGLIALKLSKLVSSITAIDLSSEMLKIAKQKAEKQSVNNIDFRIGDICNLDFPDSSFGAVIASNVLHLLFEPETAIQEIKRVVKPEGGIVIVPTYCHGENILSHLVSRIMRLIGFRARTRWSVASFQKFVMKNGFEIIKQKIIKGSIPMVYLVLKPIGK